MKACRTEFENLGPIGTHSTTQFQSIIVEIERMRIERENEKRTKNPLNSIHDNNTQRGLITIHKHLIKIINLLHL